MDPPVDGISGRAGRLTITEPTITVVVAAHDEADHIARLLRSLRNQTRMPSEVIVVDDGSTDCTARIAYREEALVITTQQRGPARARNLGAWAASGDILVFLDGDMSASRTFIDRLTEPIMAGKACGTFTKEIYIGNPENPWAEAYARVRRLAFPRLLPDSFPDVWANFRAVRRDVFIASGGYDDVGYGEDMTLAPKLEALAVAAPGARCFHFNPSSLREIAENGRWIGRGHDIGAVDHPWLDNAPWTAFRKALADIGAGADWHVLPARLGYHLGVIAGLCGRRLRPHRHWK